MNVNAFKQVCDRRHCEVFFTLYTLNSTQHEQLAYSHHAPGTRSKSVTYPSQIWRRIHCDTKPSWNCDIVTQSNSIYLGNEVSVSGISLDDCSNFTTISRLQASNDHI